VQSDLSVTLGTLTTKAQRRHTHDQGTLTTKAHSQLPCIETLSLATPEQVTDVNQHHPTAKNKSASAS